MKMASLSGLASKAGLSQTAIIGFYVMFGFFVYVTTRGELPKYLALFFGPSNSGLSKELQQVIAQGNQGLANTSAPAGVNASPGISY